jgi:hypothetical protein
MMRSLILTVATIAVAGIVAGCSLLPWLAAPSAPSSPSPALEQQRVCGRLDPATCGEVITAVTSRFPDLARAPLAVADLGKDPAHLDPGPDRWLVAFTPTDAADYWMWPPTFRVTRGPNLTNGMTAEQWRDGALPAFFVAVLRGAGVEG